MVTFKGFRFFRYRGCRTVQNLFFNVLIYFATASFLFILGHEFLRFRPLPILWSHASLTACVSSMCLLTASFKEQELSTEDAMIALGHIQTYLSRKPLQPPPSPTDFLQAASRETCAVVGGAPLPQHVSREAQTHLVDSTADLTIRLNIRTPEFQEAEGVSAPLGSRTDVLILQRGSLRSFERYIHGWGEGNETRGRVRQLAGQRFKQYSGPLVIFRPECPSRFTSCSSAWAALGNSSLPSWMDVHMLHYSIEMQTNRLLEIAAGKQNFSIGHDIPSTGVVAVIVALNMCKKVHLFSFNGSVDGDIDVPGSTVWRGHKLWAERQLLRRLGDCNGVEFEELCGKLMIYS